MGGSKKKSPSQQEKSQQSEAAKKAGGRKEKKSEKSGGTIKAEITVTLPDNKAMEFIKKAKVITAQDLARQSGVKVSAANAYLLKSLQNGTVKRVGGFSGHHIYEPVSA